MKQKYLAWKYKKAKYIYVVSLWARWGFSRERYAGLDKEGRPLIIVHNGHNGTYESYAITRWDNATSAPSVAYFFNKQDAINLFTLLNKRSSR